MSVREILKGIHEVNTFFFSRLGFVKLSPKNLELFIGNFHVEGFFPMFPGAVGSEVSGRSPTAVSAHKDEASLQGVALCPQ